MATNRRSFIKNTTVAAGMAATVPSAMSACSNSNKKVRCGLIGARGMGFHNLKNFLKQENTECVAICDVDQRVLDKRIGETEKLQGTKPKSYKDFRDLIKDEEVDAVIIGTPDHWHCLQFIEACKAGKDIYCEKPLGNTIEEVNIMEKYANKYKNVVQVGQWQRSDAHMLDAIEYVHSGKLGKIRTVRIWTYLNWIGEVPVKPDGEAPEGVDYDMWLGPAPKRPFNPNRFHFNFRWFWNYAGGLMTDWGVHLIDFGLLGMNVKAPKSVMSMGGKFAYPNDAAEPPDTQQTLFEFDDFTMMWDHAVGNGDGYYGREHGIAFVGNNGTLILDRRGWEVVPEIVKGKPKLEQVEYKKCIQSGHEPHMINFIEGIRSRNRNLSCSIEKAANTARIAHLGNLALKTGARLDWDSENSRITNNEEANKLLTPTYRAPWELPKI